MGIRLEFQKEKKTQSKLLVITQKPGQDIFQEGKVLGNKKTQTRNIGKNYIIGFIKGSRNSDIDKEREERL